MGQHGRTAVMIIAIFYGIPAFSVNKSVLCPLKVVLSPLLPCEDWQGRRKLAR